MFSFFKKKDNQIVLGSPCKGTAVALSKVNDPTFSEGMLGPGAAVIPSEGKMYAPVDGEISLVFNTLHAISMTTAQGVELLIHVGLDTVQRKGAGFTAHVKAGDQVKKGDLLLEVDLEALKADGYDVITPVVVCNGDDFSAVEMAGEGEVAPGADIIMIKK